MNEIKKVTVVGAGTMGAGIAAHLANAGVEVNLLDIVLPNEADRNKLARAGLDRMLKADLATDPFNAGLMDRRNASRIRCGNTTDDLERAVKESDWIIEVVKEDLAIKQDLFARIEACGNPGIMVTSNTSTIPLAKLTEGRGDAFKRNFAVTHWFNPPRIMRLMELVGGKDTSPQTLETLGDFCDIRLGKKVIPSNDRPGFIANRIGTFFLSRAIFGAQDAGLKIEEVDAVLGRPMGMPKTGVFGLLDVVGVGLIPLVTKSLKSNLPNDDAFVKQYREPELLNTMLAEGRTGRMSPKGGFYRVQKQENGAKLKEAVDLNTGAYRPAENPKLKSVAAGRKSIRAVFETNDTAGKFAWEIMRDTLVYACSLVPDVTRNIADIDAAMKEGYQWKWGPFEILDKIDPVWFAERLSEEGHDIPLALNALLAAGMNRFYMIENRRSLQATYDADMMLCDYAPVQRPDGVLDLGDIKRTSRPVLTCPSASVWDIGDGVLCLEFHSKMNTLDPLVLKTINDTIRAINGSEGKYKALVIYNDAKNFSAGANLGLAALFLKVADHPWAKATGLSTLARKGLHGFIGELIFQGQAAYKALREAPFPVIGAPSGMALGGGCEILLHCDAIQADAESYIGLVEAGVGIIPGWGGNVRLLERAQAASSIKGPIPALRDAAMAIMNPMAAMSSSGQDAKSKLWLRPEDGITMNRDRLLADAKQKALDLAPGYKPPQPGLFRLPGPAGKNALRMAVDGFYIKGGDPNRGGTTHYDVVVAEGVAHALTGGDTVEPSETTHTPAKLGEPVTVNPSLPLTEARMLQVERDAFLSLIQRPETEKRIQTMIATNKPYREPGLNPAPEPSAIRKAFTIADSERRDATGQPVEGRDAQRLDRMAKATKLLFKLVPQLAN